MLSMMQFENCKLSAIAIVLALMASSVVVRAEVIELAGGGRLEGKIVQSVEADEKSGITIELAGGGRVTIPRGQVRGPKAPAAVKVEYEKLARSSPDTVEEHLKLAEWCRQRKLTNEYQRHLERVLELNPDQVEARTALGFRNKDGKWLNREDVMASRGMVTYKGRYITPQQVEILEAQEKTKATQADWKNRIDQLRRQKTGRRPEQAAQADAEIRAINDPQAADAVVAALRRENIPELMRMWMEVAARLNSRVAMDALVHLSLTDPDDDVRQFALDLLVKSGRPGLSTPYVRALKDKENIIVNRAAAALGRIRDRDTIGPLIDALITTHKVKVAEGNADQHAYSFSNDSSAFSFGGGGPKIVSQAIRNRDALDALIAMSGGTSFDYDQEQWRNWLAAQAKANTVDVRRDQ